MWSALISRSDKAMRFDNLWLTLCNRLMTLGFSLGLHMGRRGETGNIRQLLKELVFFKP